MHTVKQYKIVLIGMCSGQGTVIFLHNDVLKGRCTTILKYYSIFI